MAKEKPGVMLYFDLRPCLQRLTNEQKGILFSAILDYAENGVMPELDDDAVGVAWDFVKPRIDRDAEVYAGKVEKAKAAADKRWNVPTYARACAGMPTHANALSGNAEQCKAMPKMPTTTTTTTSTSTSNRDTVTVPAVPSPAPTEAGASCAEPETVSTPPVITLPLNDGSEYLVSQEQCQEWAGLYPAVDVIQQLRGMRGWLLSNPDRRKTRRGINRFITGWLAKEQDRGGSRASSKQPPAPPEKNYDVLGMLGVKL